MRALGHQVADYQTIRISDYQTIRLDHNHSDIFQVPIYTMSTEIYYE